MIKYNDYNITGLKYNGYDIIKVIGCGGDVVYEKETPPVGKKLEATYCSGGTYTVNCNSNSTLTSGETNHQTLVSSGRYRTATIGECVEAIGDSAFEDEVCLKTVSLPNSLITIGDYAFYTTCLSSIYIPSGVTSIGYYAFANTFLESITIPNSVRTINIGAFARCASASAVTIGSGVTSIGYQAFYGCSGLTSITIYATTPPTLGSSLLGNEVFDNTNNCPIYVPSGSVNTYKSAWSTYASRIQAIQPPPPTPKKLEAIYSDTTEYVINCDSSTTLTKAEVTGGTGTTAITSANVGSCVEVIGNSAFNTCDNLSAVTISSAITSIEYRAFYNCRNLLSITIYASTPPTRGDGAFPVFGASYTVYVPAEYLNTYKSAWSNMSSRIQAIPT